jgi:hypothetical protein
MSNVRIIDDPRMTDALVSVFGQEVSPWPWPPDWGAMLLKAPGLAHSQRQKRDAIAIADRKRKARAR